MGDEVHREIKLSYISGIKCKQDGTIFGSTFSGMSDIGVVLEQSF